MNYQIKNYSQLSTTLPRRLILQIAEVVFEKIFKNPKSTPSEIFNAASQKAIFLGLKPNIISKLNPNNLEEIVVNLFKNLKDKEIGIALLELPFQLTSAGKGGINTQLALVAAKFIKPNESFICVSLTGFDSSDAAGAIVDEESFQKINNKIDYEEYKKTFNSYPIFDNLGDLVFTKETKVTSGSLLVSIKA